MNDSFALAMQDVGTRGLDDLLALVAIPSQRRSTRELSASIAKILKGVSSFVDGLLSRAISAQSKDEFRATREEFFSTYAKTIISLAQLVKIVVPEPVLERVLVESFCELEHDFREQGLGRFGIAAKDQAMFTIWTLRRTSGLISKIAASGPVPKNLKEQDEEFASNFGFFTTWTQFHLDCLLISIRRDKPVHLDVLPEIIDGLRAAAIAYGYARQGLNMRSPQVEPHIEPQEWDEEDQELLDSSMRDMSVETLDG